MQQLWAFALICCGTLYCRLEMLLRLLCCSATPQIGRTMVFEGLDQAANYRQYVCKTLRGSLADIVTLCGNKLSGRGVVLGSGFKVMPIEQAPCRFGTIPKSQQVRQQPPQPQSSPAGIG